MVATLTHKQRELGLDTNIYCFAKSNTDGHFSSVAGVTFRDQQTLTELLLSKTYDVLHVTSPAAPLAGECLRKSLYQGGVIVTSHCARDYSVGLRYDVSTGVSKYVAATIQQYYSIPVEVVYNCVDTNVFTPGHFTERSAVKSPIIGWAGRSNDPVKDIGILQALSNSSLSDGFCFLIADGSPVENDLPAWLPESARVVRKLPYDSMPGFYNELASSGGFFLSTSRDEAFAMNLMEAQACGCPVIAPALGGISEVVEDRVTGYLYDRLDGLAGIKRAIDWLYANDNRKQASQAAIERVIGNFSVDRIARQYIELYEKAASTHRSSFILSIGRQVTKVAVMARRRLRRAQI